MFATWWYRDIGLTPSSRASERMVSDPIPPSSATATAPRSTRSRLSGARSPGLSLTRSGISLPIG